MPDRGHNNPPEMIDLARDVTSQIYQWFGEHPRVTSEEEARGIKLQIDRARLCLKDLEDARDGKVRPLNERVAAINAAHRNIRQPLETLLESMMKAVDAFVEVERQRREKIAEEARQKALEAEAKAREAERLEQEAMIDAALEETGVDIQALTKEADETFAGFEAARRGAIRADQQTHVKIHGGIGRALSQREKEVLDVEDPVLFLRQVGLSEKVREAMLTGARAYKRAYGCYPQGIKVTKEKHTV